MVVLVLTRMAAFDHELLYLLVHVQFKSMEIPFFFRVFSQLNGTLILDNMALHSTEHKANN